MTTPTVNPTFVDTNVLVYTRLAASPFHVPAVDALHRFKATRVPLWTSRQVFREFLATLSRPGTVTPTPTPSELVADVNDFTKQSQVAEDGPGVTIRLHELLVAVPCVGKQVHDANIVATMLAHGVPNLLTNNVGHFTRYSTYITIIPLVPGVP